MKDFDKALTQLEKLSKKLDDGTTSQKRMAILLAYLQYTFGFGQWKSLDSLKGFLSELYPKHLVNEVITKEVKEDLKEQKSPHTPLPFSAIKLTQAQKRMHDDSSHLYDERRKTVRPYVYEKTTDGGDSRQE